MICSFNLFKKSTRILEIMERPDVSVEILLSIEALNFIKVRKNSQHFFPKARKGFAFQFKKFSREHSINNLHFPRQCLDVSFSFVRTRNFKSRLEKTNVSIIQTDFKLLSSRCRISCKLLNEFHLKTEFNGLFVLVF